MITDERLEKEERKEKRRPKIHCGNCLIEIPKGEAVFAVPGAYMNTTRRKMNICYRCAYNPPKKVIAD